MDPKTIAKSLVRVGGGRGFVVAGRNGIHQNRRYIITAAHCLPRNRLQTLVKELPYPEVSGTFPKIVGPLDGDKSVWAECVFVDPTADTAVLGTPDGQALSEEAEAYDQLLDAAVSLRLGDIGEPDDPAPAQLVALDGHLFGCTAQHHGHQLHVTDIAERIEGGMSGSPVLDAAGAAIGLVSLSMGSHGLCPRLATDLPGRFLIAFGLVEALRETRRGVRVYEHRFREMMQARFKDILDAAGGER
jgi:hypothetical protein